MRKISFRLIKTNQMDKMAISEWGKNAIDHIKHASMTATHTPTAHAHSLRPSVNWLFEKSEKGEMVKMAYA